MNFLLKILVIAVNAFFLAFVIPGVDIADFGTAIIVALVLAILDALIKPLIILLTLPATVVTFGLFLFVINALVILLDAYFVHGFNVQNFWYALLFSILLSIINSLVLGIVKGEKKS